MNLWGFQREILDQFVDRFPAFLDENLPKNPLKCEYFLPTVANAQLQEGLGTIRVLPTNDVWYGVTYAEDLQSVVDAVADMKRTFRLQGRNLHRKARQGICKGR